jgi:aryl-alcohol dehydrogenase-like predicted oxidoreductase
MTFGRETDEPTAGKILDRFIDLGGNFLDTANVYAAGASEEILGRIVGERRNDLIIATKVRFNANIFMGKPVGPNQIGLSRAHIMSEVEASLRRLKMDYIDLYQVHSWDFETPIEETMRALEDLVRQVCGSAINMALRVLTACNRNTVSYRAKSSARFCRSAARKVSA